MEQGRLGRIACAGSSRGSTPRPASSSGLDQTISDLAATRAELMGFRRDLTAFARVLRAVIVHLEGRR